MHSQTSGLRFTIQTGDKDAFNAFISNRNVLSNKKEINLSERKISRNSSVEMNNGL
jgi:hypothetical protein